MMFFARNHEKASILLATFVLSTLSNGMQTIESERRVLVSSDSWKCNEEVRDALREGGRQGRYRRETSQGEPWEVLEDVWQRIETEKAQQEREKAQRIPNIFSRRKKGKRRRKTRAVPTTIVRPLRSAPGVDAFVNRISLGTIEASSPSGCTFERGDFSLPNAKVTVVFGKIMMSGQVQLRGLLHATEGNSFRKGNIVYAECDMNAWVRDLVVTVMVHPVKGNRREGAQPRGHISLHAMDSNYRNWRGHSGKWKWPTSRRKRNSVTDSRNMNLKMEVDAVVSGRPKARFQGCSEDMQMLRKKWETEVKLNGNSTSRNPDLASLQREVEELFFSALKHAAVAYSEKTVFRVLSSNLALRMGYILSYG